MKHFARVSSSFKTFIKRTQNAALLHLIQKRKVRGLLELQLICPVVIQITRMGQNNAVCYLTYLQPLVLFVGEIQNLQTCVLIFPKIAFR